MMFLLVVVSNSLVTGLLVVVFAFLQVDLY